MVTNTEQDILPVFPYLRQTQQLEVVEGEKGENEATPSLDVEQNEEQLKPEP